MWYSGQTSITRVRRGVLLGLFLLVICYSSVNCFVIKFIFDSRQVAVDKELAARQLIAVKHIVDVSSGVTGVLLIMLFLLFYRSEIIAAGNFLKRAAGQSDRGPEPPMPAPGGEGGEHRVLEEELKNMILRTRQVQEYQEEIIRRRTAVLKETNTKLVAEIKERMRVEKDLHDIQGHLEEKVRKRTRELVLANNQLKEEVEERKNNERVLEKYQKQLRVLSSALLKAEERERRRIAVDLHDRIGQSLSVAKMYLDSLTVSCTGHEGDKLGQARELLAQTIQDTRTLTFELSPPILYELGLEAALEWLAEQLREQHGLAVTIQGAPLPEDMSSSFLALVFRTIRELLINVVRHADATMAEVDISFDSQMLFVRVVDNGQGIIFSEDKEIDGTDMGFGLFSIGERLMNIGGNLEIVSEPGQGTEIIIKVPVERSGSA